MVTQINSNDFSRETCAHYGLEYDSAMDKWASEVYACAREDGVDTPNTALFFDNRHVWFGPINGCYKDAIYELPVPDCLHKYMRK